MGGGVKGQSALLRPHADPEALAQAPQVFAEGVHIVPHADGTVAVGSTSERDVADTTTDAQLDALIARAQAICPALAEAAPAMTLPLMSAPAIARCWKRPCTTSSTSSTRRRSA